jgi:hypothetical protein
MMTSLTFYAPVEKLFQSMGCRQKFAQPGFVSRFQDLEDLLLPEMVGDVGQDRFGKCGEAVIVRLAFKPGIIEKVDRFARLSRRDGPGNQVKI